MTSEQIAASIRANVDDYWDGRVTYEEFAARQRDFWKAAEAQGQQCVDAVSATIQGGT